MKYLQCQACNFTEREDGLFRGIFPAGQTLMDSDRQECGIFACPYCHTVQYTNDPEYLVFRKMLYKDKRK